MSGKKKLKKLPSLEKQLHEAVRHGDIPTVQYLLEHGANVNRPINACRLPLIAAVEEQQVDIVKILLTWGANPNEGESHDSLDYDSVYDIFSFGLPLHECVRGVKPGDKISSSRAVVIMKLLLQHGAHIDEADHCGHTALHLAAMYGYIPLAQLLIQTGANIGQMDHDGETTLNLAVHDDRMDMAMFLIHRGAEINPNCGASPLINAIQNESGGMVKMLLKKGADLNHRGFHGLSPFLYACFRGATEMCKILAESGANLFTVDFHQWRGAFAHACMLYPNFEVMKYLSSKRVNMYHHDKAGLQPFEVACISGRADSVVALSRAGFDPQHPEVEKLKVYHIISICAELETQNTSRIWRLLKLVVAMGVKPPPLSDLDEFSRRVQVSQEHVKDMVDWLRSQVVNPMSLQNLSRLAFRRNFPAEHVDDKIEDLPLPTKIKKFLRLEEFLEHEEGMDLRCLACSQFMDECVCNPESLADLHFDE